MNLPRITVPLRRTAAAGAAALVLPFALTACGDDKPSEDAVEQAIESAGGGSVDVDIDGDDVTIENSDGSVVVGGGDLPDGFPEDEVPLVGTVQSGAATDTGTGNAWTIGTHTDKSPEDAFAEAKAALSAAGFSEEGAGFASEVHAAMKSADYGVVLSAADAGDGRTVIVYVVSEVD